MNNDELKKKIVEVLKPVIRAGNISCNEENACKKCWFPCEIERTAGRLADALIAAGIGDVKEAEHRTFVMQLALKNACEIVFSQEIDDEDWDDVIFNYKKEKGIREIGITPNILYDYLKEQAEKELAEENSGKKKI